MHLFSSRIHYTPKCFSISALTAVGMPIMHIQTLTTFFEQSVDHLIQILQKTEQVKGSQITDKL